MGYDKRGKVKPGKPVKPGKAVKPPGGASLKLGNFIFQETPYPNPRYPKIGRGTGMTVYGPGRRFTAAKPFKIADVRSKKSGLPRAVANRILRAGLTLRLGSTNHRLSKVIRIPYVYADPLLKKTVKAALVICWEGAGGGM